MTQDDIILMAQEAGMHGLLTDVYTSLDELTHFAKLVAAHEREQCFALVDKKCLCAVLIEKRGQE